MFKHKYLAFFTLFFSLIAGCKLFFTDDIQQKSAQLLDNVNSIILNASEKKDSISNQNNSQNNTSNNQTNKNPSENSNPLPNTNIESEISKITDQLHKLQQIDTLVSDISKSITDDSDSKIISNHDKEESLLHVVNKIIDDKNNNDIETKEPQQPTPNSQNETIAKNDMKDITPSSKTNDEIIIGELKNPLPKIELSGKTNNLSSMSGESSFNHEYHRYIPSTKAISGSNYSVTESILIVEDEFAENDNEDEKEETRLDNQDKFNLNKTKENVHKALKLVEKIKENANSFEFHNTMILYGVRTKEIEKNKHKEEIKKFTKEKLKNDLQKLLNEIEESSNLSEKLYAKTTQKLQAQQKLNTLKIELNSIISKVQNQPNDNEAYKEIRYRSSFKNLKTNLETVISLLDGTTGAR